MNAQLIIENLPKFFSGLWITLTITLVALAIGFVLAWAIALIQRNGWAIVRWPVQLFCFYFRGTPLLVQLFLIYYGSGQFRVPLQEMGLWQYFREAYFCGALALTLNTAAYASEIFRGGLLSVPKGEIEAGRALGMSGVKLYRRIVLPKAFRLALPAYTNEVVFLLQATSLVSTITVLDLTGISQRIISKTFAVYEIYLFVAVLYLILSYATIALFRMLERRMNAHLEA